MTLVVREIAYREPEVALAPFHDRRFSVLLDGAGGWAGADEYAYVAVDPFHTILVGPHACGEPVSCGQHPFDLLAQALPAGIAEHRPDLPPFQGGAVGFLGYELGGWLERLPRPWRNDIGVPEMAIGVYDVIVAFDKVGRRAFVVSTGLPERDPAARRRRAERRAVALEEQLGSAPLPPPTLPSARWRAETGRRAYECRVEAALDLIRRGDIYQVNLSQRFHAPMPGGLGPFDLFRALRTASAAPFAAYMNCGQDIWIVSASPERFIEASVDGAIATFPIKGTRPRASNPARDAALGAELLASPKDRAENLMIVDLLRNDLSRVSAGGSIRVPRICALESFASVHHLVSEIRGRLCPGTSPVRLLRAAFPGGSITGAPKIRAMEVIHALEGARRGAYCGVMAWIGFDGAMDSSILIRTMTMAGGGMWVQAGGGIVADSDPAAEYEESLVKARPMLDLLSADPPLVRPAA